MGEELAGKSLRTTVTSELTYLRDFTTNNGLDGSLNTKVLDVRFSVYTQLALMNRTGLSVTLYLHIE